MSQVKLAEALLRRKELQGKVDQLKDLKTNDVIYQIRSKRVQVNDSWEDITADCAKLEANQVTAEYDHYPRALRLVDAAIQQANWTCELDINDIAMADYKRV